MTVKVMFPFFKDGVKASINNQVWTSDNTKIARSLNNMLPKSMLDFYDPDPDLTSAKDATKRFGGKIISATKPKYVKGRVY